MKQTNKILPIVGNQARIMLQTFCFGFGQVLHAERRLNEIHITPSLIYLLPDKTHCIILCILHILSICYYF